MRPAVIASVARNRKAGAQRIRLMSPQFSGRRFIVMIFVGTLIFAPGVALTILGISNDKKIDELSPEHSVLYKVIGPAACGVGVCILIAAVMYYFCYGVSNVTRSRHQSVLHNHPNIYTLSYKEQTTSSGSHHRHSSHSSSHSHQQDALIEDEKHRHRHHRHHHHKKSQEDHKKTPKEDNVC